MSYMSIERLGSADNRAEWLERRKGFLGASEIFTWREVDHPKWWGDKRESIIAEKFAGVEKVFDKKTMVSINHGAFSEEDIARKFEDAIQLKVETANDQFINSQWPCIAATTDGYVHADEALTDMCGPHYCQDPRVFPRLRSALLDAGGTGVLELKRSVSTAWQKYVPDYYISQVQTQLHVLDLEWGVICADTIMRDGYRQYWDLRPYFIQRDPVWAGYLDQCNKEFLCHIEGQS